MSAGKTYSYSWKWKQNVLKNYRFVFGVKLALYPSLSVNIIAGKENEIVC